jgi:tRNA threonylcarbamoyladenosine biosynthesis protein TsaB
MRILAIDASTDLCSIALGDGTRWRELIEPAGQRHSELILPMVRALLAEERCNLAGLDGIAFGAGPGSFTGLRIACGVVQGLALGAGLRVIGICTLEAMAEQARAELGARRVIAALDARMGEAYLAAYEREGDDWRAAIEPCAAKPLEAPLPPGADWLAVGPGFAAYPELRRRCAAKLAGSSDAIVPRAGWIGRLAQPRFAAGQGVSAAEAAPMYVRERVALTAAERASGMRL